MEKYHYGRLHNRLRGQILDGTLKDGDCLPTEEDLGRMYGISRVTVRKALDQLKKSKIVRSVRGSGTVVTCRRGGYKGSLSTVLLVAPVDEHYFSTFYTYFDEVVSEEGVLVVFKCDATGELTRSFDFYRTLLDRGIHDIIFWPSKGVLPINFQACLRGVGVNLVFLDHVMETPYADCVSLDNEHIVKSLYNELISRNLQKIHYIGLKNLALSSAEERQDAFLKWAGNKSPITRLNRDEELESCIQMLVAKQDKEGKIPQAFICENAEIGTMLSRSLYAAHHSEVVIASVGEISSLQSQKIISSVDPTKSLAQLTYECLKRQNQLGDAWKAKVYRVKGELLV